MVLSQKTLQEDLLDKTKRVNGGKASCFRAVPLQPYHGASPLRMLSAQNPKLTETYASNLIAQPL